MHPVYVRFLGVGMPCHGACCTCCAWGDHRQIDGDTVYVNAKFEVPDSSHIISTRDPALAITTAALQSDLVR
jgi:hypothetical protein